MLYKGINGEFFSSLETKVGKFFLAVYDRLVIIATNPKALQGYQLVFFILLIDRSNDE